LELCIAPDQIHFLKFILEAYDGLGLLSTVSAATGEVQIRFPSACQGEVLNLLSSMASRLEYEEVRVDDLC
jgi:hypothetical protein